ncbi:MAG: cardiolipin synthase [Faecalibacterium sp.]
MRKRLADKVFNRVFVVAVLVLFQLSWICTILLGILQTSPLLGVALSILGAMLGMHIVRREGNPTYTIAWVFLIGLMPVFGGLMYLFFGNKRPSKTMHKHIDAQQALHLDVLTQQEGVIDDLPVRLRATCAYIKNYGPYPAWKNTQVKYFPLGEKMFAQMLADLRNAEHFIFIEFFIIAEGQMWQQIFDVLKDKASQGVDVRVIYDDFGSASKLPRKFVVQLETNGIHCLPFNPLVPIISLVMNHRDHRKILVIDGATAYSGGINIADEYINQKTRFGHWKDTGLRMEGAAVWNFTVMFLNLWNAFRKTDGDYEIFRPKAECLHNIADDGIVQPYSDSPLDDEPLAGIVYLELIAQAIKTVYIFTPYLIIDHEMIQALRNAAKRGVDVRIVTPGIPDKKLIFKLTRSYYAPLIEAGVKIYEYTPGFIHAKSFLCDGKVAVVGSINMDYRSLYLNFECGTLLVNNSQIAEIANDYANVFEKSRMITHADCHDGVVGQFVEDVLRVLSPLL